MSKAILIFDEIPEWCLCCPCCDNDCRCWAADGEPTETPLRGTTQWGKPDWCPLRQLPEKKEVRDASMIIFQAQKKDINPGYYNGWLHGWNDCLDAIGGEK